MPLLNLVILFANLAALVLLVSKGDASERWAAGFILLTIVSEIFVDGLTIGTWRLGIALVNAGLLAAFWILATRADRWWLIFASAVQLLIVISALMPILSGGFMVHTGIAIRLGLWTLVSLILFFGVWEACAARRLSKESFPNVQRPVPSSVP
ncbi:MAG: hypothetical protein EON90_12660 [Brevundimonas sp.]|nr:MAG: hypothetical protein EON90_12660 [Brevundimonas sp.]